MLEYTRFSSGLDKPPIVQILPGLEALVSVRLGDDPSRLWEFWKRLVRDIQPQTTHVFDNRPEDGALQPATDNHKNSVRQAFEAACQGPGETHRIDWSTLNLN